MLGIMAGMAQKDSYAAGVVTIRVMFTSVVNRPWMLGIIMAGMIQKDFSVVKVVNIPVVAQRLFPWCSLFCGPSRIP